MYKGLVKVFLALMLACSAINLQDHPSAAVSILPMSSVDELEIHSAKLDAGEAPNATVEIAKRFPIRIDPCLELPCRDHPWPAGDVRQTETCALIANESALRRRPHLDSECL